MAIQTRGGNEADFQPNKMIEREMAGTLDTKKVFYTFAPGDCRRLATHEEMTEMIDESVDGIKQGFTADITQAITDAETATATAAASAQNADDKALIADGATTRAITAAENAEAIVLGDIATDTTVGIVKGGGDVVVEVDGTMSVNEASNANVTVVEAVEDGELTTGLLSVILGLIKKKFALMLTALAGKIDKTSIAQSAEISDATKVPSTVVTAWLASQISSLAASLTATNNNLAMLGTLEAYVICSQIQGAIVYSTMIPLVNANGRNISITKVQVTAEYTLTGTELALLAVSSYKSGFAVRSLDATLNAKIAGKSIFVQVNVV